MRKLICFAVELIVGVSDIFVADGNVIRTLTGVFFEQHANRFLFFGLTGCQLVHTF